MKLGLSLIVAGALAWLWFITSVEHHLSPGQWIASVALLLMFVWPGVTVLSDTLSDRRRAAARNARCSAAAPPPAPAAPTLRPQPLHSPSPRGRA
jgi:hypothetical protein